MTAPIPAWVDGRLRPVDKLAVHRDGLRHMAVSVFVLCGEALLLQRRAQGKYHTPGLWANTCCSHPQWGERAADCAVRRLREELGVTGIGLQPMGRIEYRADVGGGMVDRRKLKRMSDMGGGAAAAMGRSLAGSSGSAKDRVTRTLRPVKGRG